MPVLFCNHCGENAAWRAGARFCAACGTGLNASCGACGQAGRPGDRYCAYCGRAMTGGYFSTLAPSLASSLPALDEDALELQALVGLAIARASARDTAPEKLPVHLAQASIDALFGDALEGMCG